MRIFAIKYQAGITRNNIFEQKTQRNNSISFGSANDNFQFSKVDETLYRGSRPTSQQLLELKEIGVSTIIDLTTEPFVKPNYNEADCAKILGMKHVKIPLVSYTNPSDKQVKTFFKEIELAKKNNQKVYIHCLDDGDRTGLFVELYRIKYRLSDVETSINTLRRNNYNFSENPKVLTLLHDFEKKCNRNYNTKFRRWR